MTRVLVLLLCLLGTTRAYALEVTKPDGGVVGYVPHYDVTVAVVAMRISTIGEGLAVLERKSNGKWELCGQCMPSPQDLAAEVKFQGGEVAYINSQRNTLNALLARRYPPIMSGDPPPAADIQSKLNATLAASFKLDGAVLAPK